MKRGLALVAAALAIVALVLSVATAKQMREGARALSESDTALARGDVATSIARARAAAEATAPGSPYPSRAYDRLAAMARDAEAHGNEASAMAAWSAMRAAAIETRGPLVDTDAWRTMADDGIARVGSTARDASEVRPSQTALRDALARSDVPPVARVVLLGIVTALFFAGAARLLVAAAKRSEARR